jgi:hypothetical protein
VGQYILILFQNKSDVLIKCQMSYREYGKQINITKIIFLWFKKYNLIDTGQVLLGIDEYCFDAIDNIFF